MAYEYLLYEKQRQGVLITLNRPEALNALSDPLMDELGQALRAFEQDDSIGAIVITGSEKAFAAGADIKGMKDRSYVDVYLGDFIGQNWEQVTHCRKPVIAAVNGICCGGGLELALSADLILASEQATFALPEINSGTIADAATLKLPRRVPYHVAMELLLTGRWMDAIEAHHWGLVNETLLRALQQRLGTVGLRPGPHRSLRGASQVDRVVQISQAPIGRTPRSNAATYTGVFDRIRKLFAQTEEARVRGYQPGRFSFNVKGGRCEACSGDGTLRIEMHFLPDVYVPCEVCKGARYNRDTLDIEFKGRTIADVLDMSCEEALGFFEKHPPITRHMQTLVDVGLGYIRLGQSAPTLSGGEAQRVKLASELAKRPTGHTVYILDEPTTGLHFEDVRRLLAVLSRLVDQGNSVIVIEHNLDVVKTADWLLDLGPEGGRGGGAVVATGTPEEVAAASESHTGRYLRDVLAR
jgi:enoyl-CoA hydratase/carnithine racemase/ABC-type Na+ transport system ATPase subunit NatA